MHVLLVRLGDNTFLSMLFSEINYGLSELAIRFAPLREKSTDMRSINRDSPLEMFLERVKVLSRRPIGCQDGWRLQTIARLCPEERYCRGREGISH